MFIDTLHNRFNTYFFDDNPNGGGGGSGNNPNNTEVKQEVKQEQKQDLKDVIKKAAVETEKQIGEQIKEEEEKKEEKKEIKQEVKEEKKEEKKDEEDLSEEQLGFAKTLYKALNNNDPQIQLKTLRILANAANLDLKEIETKKEVEKAEETLLDLLKAGLGEFDFLADKLAPALEKAFEKFVEKKVGPIEKAQKEERDAKTRTEVNNAIEEAFGEFTNSAEVKDDVLKLMDQFKPGPKMGHKEYFRSLIVLAANNKNITLKSTKDIKNSERIERNRNDANTRLASERNAEPKDVVRGTQFKNVKAAVADAIEQLSQGKK